VQNGRSGYLKRPIKFVRCFLVARAGYSHADVIRNADSDNPTLLVADQHFTSSVELARADS